jgi:peptide/nickel transport system ATP-binding protein
MTEKTILSVDDLSVTFKPEGRIVEAVRSVSFSVAKGETYGLVGESGSGKSTVLRAIAGLVPDITGGSMTVDGERQGKRRTALFHRRVQMVFQDPYGSLHPRHTVDKTLREPLSINGIQDRDERIEQILIDVGLDKTYRFRYPHQLSGGQRQRVAIARAIILNPEILLLDEPTSALDVSVQAEILNLLNGLRSEYNLTILLVSHNLAVVSHMCDRMSVMNRGRIVENLSVGQLREEIVTDPYTVELLTAAKGFDRERTKSFFV